MPGYNNRPASVGEARSLPRSIIHKNKPGWANSYDVRHDTIQRNTQFRYVAGGYEPPLQFYRGAVGIRPTRFLIKGAPFFTERHPTCQSVYHTV